MLTTPNDGTKPYPYIPGPFPDGTWKISSFELSNTDDYGPFKIRTDATRFVEAWHVSKDKKGNDVWKKILDKKGRPLLVRDNGLLIHGGGYSMSPQGVNNFLDNTLGCIRINNEDAKTIVAQMSIYLKQRGYIELEVGE